MELSPVAMLRIPAVRLGKTLGTSTRVEIMDAFHTAFRPPKYVLECVGAYWQRWATELSLVALVPHVTERIRQRLPLRGADCKALEEIVDAFAGTKQESRLFGVHRGQGHLVRLYGRLGADPSEAVFRAVAAYDLFVSSRAAYDSFGFSVEDGFSDAVPGPWFVAPVGSVGYGASGTGTCVRVTRDPANSEPTWVRQRVQSVVPVVRLVPGTFLLTGDWCRKDIDYGLLVPLVHPRTESVIYVHPTSAPELRLTLDGDGTLQTRQGARILRVQRAPAGSRATPVAALPWGCVSGGRVELVERDLQTACECPSSDPATAGTGRKAPAGD